MLYPKYTAKLCVVQNLLGALDCWTHGDLVLQDSLRIHAQKTGTYS